MNLAVNAFAAKFSEIRMGSEPILSSYESSESDGSLCFVRSERKRGALLSRVNGVVHSYV